MSNDHDFITLLRDPAKLDERLHKAKRSRRILGSILIVLGVVVLIDAFAPLITMGPRSHSPLPVVVPTLVLWFFYQSLELFIKLLLVHKHRAEPVTRPNP